MTARTSEKIAPEPPASRADADDWARHERNWRALCERIDAEDRKRAS